MDNDIPQNLKKKPLSKLLFVADVAQRLGTTTHSLYAWIKRYGPDKVNELKKLPRKNKLAIRYVYLKASIQAKVEHPFRIVKCQFGFVKASYKELAKNDSQLVMLFNLANLVGVDQLISAQARFYLKWEN